MAIDSRDKRASATCVGIPWRGMLPVADTVVDANDRLQLASLYRIAAAAPTPAGGSWPNALARTLAAHRALYGQRPEWFEDDAFMVRGH